MAQVFDHHFQVGHMVIGKTQDFLILLYLDIALFYLCLKLVDPFSCLSQFFFLGFQLFQCHQTLLVIAKVSLSTVSMYPGLECYFHRSIGFCQLLIHSKLF